LNSAKVLREGTRLKSDWDVVYELVTPVLKSEESVMEILKVVGITAVVLAGVAGAAFTLSAFGVVAFKIPQYATITLTESGDDLIITNESGGRGKCAQPHPGCVEVAWWRKANIKFKLENMADWQFKQIQLVAASGTKLDFQTQIPEFEDEMSKDFYVKIDNKKEHPDEDGIINLDNLDNGEEFTLKNRNKFEQTYTYQVQACNGEVCKAMDPKIQNEGDK